MQPEVIQHQGRTGDATIGLLMPWRALPGADPWTCPNMDGKRRSGFKLALAARRRLPALQLQARELGAGAALAAAVGVVRTVGGM